MTPGGRECIDSPFIVYYRRSLKKLVQDAKSPSTVGSQMDLLEYFNATSMPRGGDSMELYSKSLSIISQMEDIYRNDTIIQLIKHRLMNMRFSARFLPGTKRAAELVLTGEVEVKEKVGVVQVAGLGKKNSRNPASAAASPPVPNVTSLTTPFKKCHICNVFHHLMYQCSKKVCTTCGGRGHWEAQCRTAPALLAAADANNVLQIVSSSPQEIRPFLDDEDKRDP